MCSISTVKNYSNALRIKMSSLILQGFFADFILVKSRFPKSSIKGPKFVPESPPILGINYVQD